MSKRLMTPLDSELCSRPSLACASTGNNGWPSTWVRPLLLLFRQCHKHLPRTCGGCSRSRTCSLGTAGVLEHM